MKFEGKLHKFHFQLSDLIEVCRNAGSLVAEIREEKANEAIFAQIGTMITGNAYTFTDFVIGSGSDEKEEGKWVWASDGQQFIAISEVGVKSKFEGEYSNWLKDPRNENYEVGNRKRRNCMCMAEKILTPGTWFSIECKHGQKVACEAKAVVGQALKLTPADAANLNNLSMPDKP